jgi:cephalosporin hydroxylase
MDTSARNPRFFGRDYIVALKEHYPDLVEGERVSTVDAELRIGFIEKWMRAMDKVGVDLPTRFQRLADRPWSAERSAWQVSGGGGDLRHVGAYGSYKGLINLKPAIDLVLYSNLIWELRPETILEFGSLQGGSACWFADQLQVLCGRGEVHSFELCYKCISPKAAHPFLHFHESDLRDLTTLDKGLLEQMPHPWLVVDDAHENLPNLVPFLANYMLPGDYFVIEDAFLHLNASKIAVVVKACTDLGFLVDSKYTDAFGLNVTCSPNGWLVKQ